MTTTRTASRTTRVLATSAFTVLLATTATPALAGPAPIGPAAPSHDSKAQVEHAERQQTARTGVSITPDTQTGDSSGLGAGDWEFVLASLLGAVAVGSLAVAANHSRSSVRPRTS